MTAVVQAQVALGRCTHCGQESSAAFCCAGCAAAHRLVQELGLERYYRLRTSEGAPQVAEPPPVGLDDLATRSQDGTATLALSVQGLRCGACVWLIETALQQQEGVRRARVAPIAGRLDLTWDANATDADRLAGVVGTLGYGVAPWNAGALDRDGAARDKELLLAMAVAGFAAANVMLISVGIWAGHFQDMDAPTRDLLHWLSALIALPALAFAGRPFFRSALAALRAGRTNMDVPISLALILAPAVSLIETASSGPHAYFDSALTLAFFLLVGRYLDSRARSRARSAVAMLSALEGRTATVLEAGGTPRVRPIEQVRTGMLVLVPPGGRFPIDGTIVEGQSEVDTSPISGEALPVKVGPATVVHAGTLNVSAPLKVRVDAVGDATLIAEMGRLMAAVEGTKGRYVALADRVARLYSPLVHALALATLLGWRFLAGASWADALLAAVAVLIVTCPCALALAMPVSLVAAGRRLLAKGILVKSPTALERLADVNTVAFDKTGTLTLGRLALTGLYDAADLALAASLAAGSRHPLSRALAKAAPAAAPAANVVEEPGRGLRSDAIRLGSRAFCDVPEDASAGPELWLTQPGRKPLRFRFTDRLRPDAAEAVARLRRLGLEVELTSGDRHATVAETADAVGIATWYAAQRPAEKAAHLARLAAAGRRVLMVGDGINDAAALATAHASLVPASGVDIARAGADATFQGERLAAVVELVEVARRTRRIVRQNIALAIVYNLAAVPLAMAGWLTPLIAAIAMSSSSLLVVCNASRIGR
jgi:P-type Cu2+ transporter